MFSILLKIKRWIKKRLKVTSESRQAPRSSGYSRSVSLLLLLVSSILIVVLLYPGDKLFDPLDTLRRGDIAPSDIIAEFQIVVEKNKSEIETESKAIKAALPYIVDHDSLLTEQIFTDLKLYFDLIDSIKNEADSIPATASGQTALIDKISRRFPRLSGKVVAMSLHKTNTSRVYSRLNQILRDDIYSIGVLPDINAIPETGSKYVLVRRGERENIYARGKFYDIALANGRLLTLLNRMFAIDSINVDYYYPLGQAFIKPNLRINMIEYHQRLKQELDDISMISEIVNPGDTIVRAFSKVDSRQQKILEGKKRIEQTLAVQKGWLVSVVPVLTRIALTLLCLSFLFLFLYHYRREIYNSTPRLVAILGVFGLQLLIINLERSILSPDLSIYLYPVAFLPIMITILFDDEVGVLSTLVLAIMLGIFHRFNFTLCFMTIVVGTISCFASREVRKRSHFFRIMGVTGLTYAILILLVETMKITPARELWTEVGFGVVNGFVSALLTIGLLPVFESLFGITTDITLLELSDFNNPLLKRLAIEAPGTYHHSITVGNLAEAAAKSIGGNPLLTRVGCYYHDIGKMEVSDYFVENQLSVKSKHDSLTPSMSALILSSHVKKGRMLGEEADLPDDVLNFIEEHHGTMVMTYFYSRALEQGADESSIDKFRYPGPKPQIRETAIAMLADAVEAASRTLDDPKPARISNLIQRIINDRFQSGELDECPLTLRDLAKIKEAFEQILIGSFHHRVVYPKGGSVKEIKSARSGAAE